MSIFADLQVHSKYAQAVSKEMEIGNMAIWAQKKGINLLGTGDFTHPRWLGELKENLKEEREGIYKLRSGEGGVEFLLTSEVSCIWSHKGKRKGVHVMVWLPTLESVERFNAALAKTGANLGSDGRPIIGMSVEELSRIALGVEPMALVIPAHSFTPWFGVYGANGGFDSLEEAFGQMHKYIWAVETGLGADPGMVWAIGELENRQILSFSDAHSLAKMGREMTVFESRELEAESFNCEDIYQAIKGEGQWRVGYTVKFFPEEGKYHWDGHRNCGVSQSPIETWKNGEKCPVCRRRLTIGAKNRIGRLENKDVQVVEKMKDGICWINDARGLRPRYVRLVPLVEIIAQGLGVKSTNGVKVGQVYEKLVLNLGSEIDVLMTAGTDEIAMIAGEKIAKGVGNARKGDVRVIPGYDGVYGKITVC